MWMQAPSPAQNNFHAATCAVVEHILGSWDPELCILGDSGFNSPMLDPDKAATTPLARELSSKFCTNVGSPRNSTPSHASNFPSPQMAGSYLGLRHAGLLGATCTARRLGTHSAVVAILDEFKRLSRWGFGCGYFFKSANSRLEDEEEVAGARAAAQKNIPGNPAVVLATSAVYSQAPLSLERVCSLKGRIFDHL